MNYYELLAKQSIVDGKQTLNEDQVRSMVGAPSVSEADTCACGDNVNTCPDSYEHMTHGV